MASHDTEIRAAEYVLGLLDAAEMEKAERQRTADHDFAAAIEEWEILLSPLAETGQEIPAPPHLRAQIEARMDAHSQDETRQPPALAGHIEALQRSLAAWRMAAIGAAAAAAAIALAWFGGLDMPLRPGAPPERYVAMLRSDTGETGFVVTFDMEDKTCAIRKMAPDLPAAKAYELWAMMKNDKPPMSLGIIGADSYSTTTMPLELHPTELEKGVKLAISMEPPGGAPLKSQMGPVIFAGELIKLTP